MLKKIADGFHFGLGFSCAALLIFAAAWFVYNFPHDKQNASNHPAVSSKTSQPDASLSETELKQKECSLLILLYGETQDADIADPIKKHCR